MSHVFVKATTAHRRSGPRANRSLSLLHRTLLLGLAALFLAASLVPPPAYGQTPNGTATRQDLAVVIELTGPIDGLTGSSIETQVKRALERSPRFIILEIDSPGGELFVAKDIAFNFAKHMPAGVRTVAFVKRMAYSSATIISMGCDEIAMTRDGSIGDVLPIFVQRFLTHDEVSVAEKMISPVREDLRHLAELRGYPADAAAKMCDPRIELLRVDLTDPATGRPRAEWVARETFDKWPKEKRARMQGEPQVVEEPGKLLVLKSDRATEMGFCKYVANDVNQLCDLIKNEHSLEKLVPERIATLWWEHVVRFITWLPVKLALFGLGVIAFIIALLHPGMGVPEAVAIVAFGLCFFGGYLIGLSSAIELVIFVVGVALVAAEVLGGMPGHGALGVTGGIMIFLSLLLSLQSFVIPSTPEQWDVFKTNLAATGGSMIFSVFGVAAALRFLPKTRLLSKLVHTDEQAPDAGLPAPPPAQATLTGARGVAATTLRPAGKVEVAGELLEASAEQGYIEKGTPVVVTGRRGNEVIVAVATGTSAAGADAPASGGPAPGSPASNGGAS